MSEPEAMIAGGRAGPARGIPRRDGPIPAVPGGPAAADPAPVEAWVELSHGRTRYLRVGAGHPVLFLHGVGFTDGAESWSRAIRHLAPSHDAIAVDLLGWGDGDRLEAEYSFAYLVDFVREFQDALGLRSCDVVGHSMGGWVASLLAYESPQRVDRLVLVASGGTATRPLGSMTRFEPPASAGEIRRALIDQRGHPDDAATEALARAQFERGRTPGRVEAYRRILRHMTDPVHRARYSTVRRLPMISAPTLVVWGRHDDVNDLELGRRTAELVHGSELVVLDCGHFPMTQATGEFHDALTRFLDR
ncbi:MAG: alpha/beta hydrolase [Acidobacteriota bacterium]|nr:alpha/beta hydrolase [Acidobacteriota bacterium]